MLILCSMAAEAKIDEDAAAEMLHAGESVRDVAHRFGVSTQAIYLAIRQGRLPARARDARTADAAASKGGQA